MANWNSDYSCCSSAESGLGLVTFLLKESKTKNYPANPVDPVY
jgi:hypothetical protein